MAPSRPSSSGGPEEGDGDRPTDVRTRCWCCSNGRPAAGWVEWFEPTPYGPPDFGFIPACGECMEEERRERLEDMEFFD